MFACVPYRSLLDTLVAEKTRAFSPLGRPGHSTDSLLKAILASFYLHQGNTAATVRRLRVDPLLAVTCGFDPRDIPSRSTLSRFQKKLGKHHDLVLQCTVPIGGEFKAAFPGFGKNVAVDSTPVPSYSNPDKRIVSDPEAGWIAKGGAEKHKTWVFGYRLHLVIDADYEIPISCMLSLAKIQDSQAMLPLLRQAGNLLPWFNPEAVIADKGYDSGDNYEGIAKEFDASPIIPLSARSSGPAHEITGSSAAPCCSKGFPLIYRSWDKKKGVQYACPARAGRVVCPIAHDCSLKVVWVRPVHDYRRFGHRIKRRTQEYKRLYRKRGAIERVNARLKDHRRLESHCFRGFDSIEIHATLSVLVMQAMALAKVRAGRIDEVRECVTPVS